MKFIKINQCNKLIKRMMFINLAEWDGQLIKLIFSMNICMWRYRWIICYDIEKDELILI